MNRKIDINDIAKISDALNKKFPEGNDPFQIITRLAEEVGELATTVNHFERTGVKTKKLGEPTKERIADEAKDVIHVVLQLVRYYKIEKELEQEIKKSIKRLEKEKLIENK